MQEALIYLHGFNSASQDEKGNLLPFKSKLHILNHFCEQNNFRFVAPNLDYQHIENVIEKLIMLESQLDVDGLDVTFIGTSLGGFFAEYMAMKTKTSAVMINPAITPSTTLTHHIGMCKNYATDQEYFWKQENCVALKPYEQELANFPYWGIGRTVLVDRGDEILDSEETIRKYQDKASLHIFEGGSHRFDHMEEALPFIKSAICNIFLPLTDD